MKVTLSAIAILAISGSARAGDTVLWEQAPDAALDALVDQNFADAPIFSSYLMADVTVGIGGWDVDSVTTYFTNTPGNLVDWSTVTGGMLTLTPKTGAYPENSYNPQADGILVDVSVAIGADGYELTASGLGMILDPGDWWIGLTPMAAFSTFGQEFHQDHGALVGDRTAFRNPGGGFAMGTDWLDTTVISGTYVDMAIKITAAPAPGALALLGLACFGLRRRRR